MPRSERPALLRTRLTGRSSGPSAASSEGVADGMGDRASQLRALLIHGRREVVRSLLGDAALEEVVEDDRRVLALAAAGGDEDLPPETKNEPARDLARA